MGIVVVITILMPFAKGAFSRHMMNRSKKRQRVAQFGSRSAYRKSRRAMGGKGGSW